MADTTLTSAWRTSLTSSDGTLIRVAHTSIFHYWEFNSKNAHPQSHFFSSSSTSNFYPPWPYYCCSSSPTDPALRHCYLNPTLFLSQTHTNHRPLPPLKTLHFLLSTCSCYTTKAGDTMPEQINRTETTIASGLEPPTGNRNCIRKGPPLAIEEADWSISS